MHMIKTYENLRTKLEREVADIEKNELTKESVEILHHLVASLYKLNCLIDEEYAYEEGQSNGYYNGGHSYGIMRIPHIGTMSYGRWGRDGDGDGYYNESSRDNFRNSSYRGSNDSGYSRDNAARKMVQKLETLKDDTMSERERIAIDNCINEISR